MKKESAQRHNIFTETLSETMIVHSGTVKSNQMSVCIKLYFLTPSRTQQEACYSFVSRSTFHPRPCLRKASQNGFHSLAEMRAACRGAQTVSFSALLKVCHILNNRRKKRKKKQNQKRTAMFSSIFNERE